MVVSLDVLWSSDPISSILGGDTIDWATKEAKKELLEKKKLELVGCGIKDLLTYYSKLTDPDDKDVMKQFIIENFSSQEYDAISVELAGLRPEDANEIEDIRKKRAEHLEEVEKTRKQNREQSEFLKSLLGLGDVDPKLLESVASIPENQTLLEEVKNLKIDWELEVDPTKKARKKIDFMEKKRELRKKVFEKFTIDRKKLHDVLFRNYTYDSTDFDEMALVNRRKWKVETRSWAYVEVKYNSESIKARRRLNRAIEELNKIDSDHPEDGVSFVFRKAWMRWKKDWEWHVVFPTSIKPIWKIVSSIRKKIGMMSEKDRDAFEKSYDEAVEKYLAWIGIDKIIEDDADEIIKKVKKKFDAIKEAYKQKIVKLI